MTIEETRAVWERFKAADRSHHSDAMRGVYAEDVVSEALGLRGRELFVRFDSAFYAAFPDYRREYTQEIVGEDAVAFTWRWTGTHTGRFLGIDATGRHIAAEGCTVFSVRDGFISRAQSFGPNVREMLLAPEAE